MVKQIKTHGGKRKGSGRPKLPADQKKEPTKVMRIPVSKVDVVLSLIGK
jgi:hypothetical protein